MKTKFSLADILQMITTRSLLLVLSFLLSSAYANGIQAQDHQMVIRGKVVDEKNEPMAGATVMVKLHKMNAVTDLDGNFEIRLRDAKFPMTLIVQYIGYQTEQISINSRNERRSRVIVMKQSGYSLSDVVVMGYGKSSRKKLTGAIAKISSNVISQVSQEAPIMAIQGNAPGVYVSQGSGVPGGGESKIVIRGITTLSEQHEPLYVIDGIPFNSIMDNEIGVFDNGVLDNPDVLSLINPADIESIEILKDADATAIYGTKGANGVVLITTRKGETGKVKVDASYTLTSSYVGRFLEMLSVEDYLDLRRKAVQRDLDRGLISQKDLTASNYPDLLLWDQHKDYNWQEEMMGKTAFAHDAQLRFSGGNKNTSFLVSGAFYNSNTVVISDDDYTRWSARANFQHRSDNDRFRLNLGLTMSGVDMISKGQRAPNTSLATAPNTPILDEFGRPYYIPDDPDYRSNTSFLAYAGESKTVNFIGNFDISYEIIKNLRAKVTMGYNYTGSSQTNKNGRYFLNPYDPDGFNQAMYGNNNNYSIQVEPQITYDVKVGGLKIGALAGATYQRIENRWNMMAARNFPTDDFMDNIKSAASILQTDVTMFQTKSASLFARVTLDYEDRYLLNGTYRRDGSSRFGPGHRFGNFYSIGAAWLFSNEKFIRENGGDKILSHGKIRFSYGRTGNDGIGDYAYMTKYETTPYPYEGQIGVVPDNIANPDLHWETTDKMDLSLELGFIKDRILLNATWFQNYSTDLLTNQPIASQSGFSSIPTNLDAQIKNWGYELELNTQNIKTKNFSWKTNFNITFPHNKLTKFRDLENSSYYRTYRLGESTEVFLGYNYQGIDPETGLPMIEDTNGDGRLSSADYQALGDTDPDFYGGLNNTLSFKGFTLDINFYFRKKPITSGYNYYYSTPIGMMHNVTREQAQSYWTGPGDTDAEYPGLTTTAASDEYKMAWNYLRRSQYIFSNGSYFRLRDVMLSYNLPAKVLSKMYLSNLRVFVQGRNLFTATKYDSYDPETGGNVPTLTSWVVGLNMSF